MKLFLFILVAAVASTSSFIVHVISAEWLPAWVGAQMQGTSIKPSWDVRYIAAVTSIEYGLAASALYYLARDKLVVLGTFKASLLFAVLLAAIHADFIRQPLMGYIVGNPIHVVLVQHSFQWLLWLLMSFVVVYGVEFMIEPRASKYKKTDIKPSVETEGL